MLRTGRLLHPASHPASRPRTGAFLPGTLASPRAGLPPAGCRELVARLRGPPPPFSLAPELLDARRVHLDHAADLGFVPFARHGQAPLANDLTVSTSGPVRLAIQDLHRSPGAGAKARKPSSKGTLATNPSRSRASADDANR